MILEASGHAVAMVNGEPRVGDPYEMGYVKLPVLLKAGGERDPAQERGAGGCGGSWCGRRAS